MSGIKRLMEEVAERMEIDDPNDSRVKAEVERLLSINHRRLIVVESHPNSGGFWTGKIGTEQEVLQYLQKLEKDGNLDYIFAIAELKEGSDDEVADWIEFDGIEPIKLREVAIGSRPEGTPPLPGLEKRLAGIEADAYGLKKSAWSILQSLTDEEICEVLSDLLQGLLQMGRELPVWEKKKCET